MLSQFANTRSAVKVNSSLASISLRIVLGLVLALAGVMTFSFYQADAAESRWARDWPNTDFSQATISLREIEEGGPPKDGIPAIDQPRFSGVDGPYPIELGEEEPVIAFAIGDDARAYPLRILMLHEIVNDVVGGRPVTITYCPLCNTAIIFDRQLDGTIYNFGVTGKLRNSDLIMYDRQTESWWQQFTGEAVIGELAGRKLRILPSRIESISLFRSRYPTGKILLPAYRNPDYYENIYQGYDRARTPLLFSGRLPRGIRAMARVVAVEDRAWALARLVEEQVIEEGDLVLSWTPGQNSALHRRDISLGRDVGNVVVQRHTAQGLVDVVHHVTFAFAFHAFYPEAEISQ